ncbi:hypothetical protein G9464_17500 [Halostella sp. JP-L12]|uniref:hypothetical protein n=1 Tax=Halostella TaxID=1843185 RepID=UPI000EF789C5|nr:MULTISPECIES: hypothetical protein [Halostella]NHN49369.1 hypothetical protein [Halostella sp. JP-L12]
MLIESLWEEYGDEIEAVAQEIQPCEYCATQHYEQYILWELLDRALWELDGSGTLERRFSADE